jgi:site-specific recombinase XerD
MIYHLVRRVCHEIWRKTRGFWVNIDTPSHLFMNCHGTIWENGQDRGVRKMFAPYAVAAGITHSMSPHKWRHFIFAWLKKKA